MRRFKILGVGFGKCWRFEGINREIMKAGIGGVGGVSYGGALASGEGRSWSFENGCVPKLELGNEERKVDEGADGGAVGGTSCGWT